MLACCPLHDDKCPSFGYNTATGQWRCFSKCGKGDVFDYLARTTGQSFREVLTGLGDQLGLERPSSNGDGTITYEYRDAEGALLYQVLRGPNKKFWQRRPDGNVGWINALKGVHSILYRLPDLLARPDETVFVVEGEKDADRLRREGVLATTNSGGAGKWKPPLSESLRGRDIVILPDNDAPGRDHARQVAQGVHGLAASVRIVPLPGLPEKGDVSDWLAAGHTLQELQQLVSQTNPWKSDSEKDSSSARPTILITGRQLRAIFTDAWDALLPVAEELRLFRYAGTLGRIVDGEAGLQVTLLDEGYAFGLAHEQADWVAQRGKQVVDAKPPSELARDLLVLPEPRLPALEGIVSAPVFLRWGRLLATPGYDAESRLWYEPSRDLQLPAIPQVPTEADVEGAVQLLTEELLVDFEFAAESDLAHALAALLLPFVRRLIDGPTPVHLLEAPTPGSGKSLLADLISIVALGRCCEATTVTRNEDESRKKLTAILSRGRPIVVIDNLQGALESAQLAAAITAEIWSDRLLGKTQMVEFPNRALWIVTGNNPKLSMEIARRCIRIRLEPHQERPWERTGFKHDPIRTWAREHRSELVRAVLVIVKHWLVKGRPAGNKTLGSFEVWATTMGGILRHAGVRGFLEDTQEFYQAADYEAGEWRALVTAWHEQYQTAPVAPSTLLALAEAQHLVPFACAGPTEQARLVKFGKALATLRGRRFGDLQVMTVENRKRCSNDYRLIPVAGELFHGKEASE